MSEVLIQSKKSIKSGDLIVTKRNGNKEVFEAEKINKVLLWATQGLSGVSASDVAMNAQLQFYPGIKTSEIHKVLIQSAVDMINEKAPNYQYVASNLLNYLLRKEVFETKIEMPSLIWTIKRNIQVDLYDSIILDKYNEDEISDLDKYIKHDRDYELTYAGLQQLIDKYLVKDRSTGRSYETPQFCFMMISMTVFADYDKSIRTSYVKELYDMISEHKISLPTPIVAGIRTPNRQFSSCTLIEIGDSLDSIFYGNVAIGQYVAKRAGIGINAGSIRALGSKVRNGEVVHTGVIPFFKMFQSTLHSCSQGGIRKGSATLYFPWWHKEIEDVLVLKNNKGTDDNRVRHMDYGIQFEKLFYSRFVANGEVSLFSPSDVPGLYDVFGLPEFEEAYKRYESDRSIPRKTIKARDLMNSFAQERIQTGRMYVMNIDNANNNSPFLERMKMSNLCLDIDSSYINSVQVNGNLYEKLLLSEIIDLFNDGNQIKVLSKNMETNELEFKEVEKAWITKENAEVLEIEDIESGYKIICTEDHLVFTKNRGWVEAGNLLENDMLDII